MSEPTKQDRSTLEAIRALRLGHAYLARSGAQTRFTILMDHAPSATEHRLGRLADRVEAHGYRVVSRGINDATLRVDCVRSEKSVGTVVRIARDGDASIMTLHGTANAGLWTVPDHAADDRRILLLTRPDDQVVIWRDVDAEGAPGQVTTFRNRTLPTIA